MTCSAVRPLEPAYDPARCRGVADELERWVSRLPTWDLAHPEPWKTFLARLRRSEELLAVRLRRLPSCGLTVSEDGQVVQLSLAGLAVHARHGLVDACQLWIAKAKRGAA